MTTATIARQTPRTTTPSRASMPAAVGAVAVRTVRKFVRTPQLVVVGAIQSVMFLLIFRYVFGGAISIAGISYVNFLIPGFITTGVLFSGTGAAVGVADDLEQGFFDRLRSLPIPRTSILAGRSVADTLLLTWNLLLTIAVGFLVGFRLEGSLVAGLAAFGLCVLYGYAFGWVFITIGLYAGNAEAAQGMSLLVFPLTFVSSAYVPVASMPGWLQPFAEHQPITVMVDAVRSLTLGARAHLVLGQSTAHYVVVSLLWTAALIAVFVPIAGARFRRS